jgi:hypothetical protein
LLVNFAFFSCYAAQTRILRGRIQVTAPQPEKYTVATVKVDGAPTVFQRRRRWGYSAAAASDGQRSTQSLVIKCLINCKFLSFSLHILAFRLHNFGIVARYFEGWCDRRKNLQMLDALD